MKFCVGISFFIANSRHWADPSGKIIRVIQLRLLRFSYFSRRHKSSLRHFKIRIMKIPLGTSRTQKNSWALTRPKLIAVARNNYIWTIFFSLFSHTLTGVESQMFLLIQVFQVLKKLTARQGENDKFFPSLRWRILNSTTRKNPHRTCQSRSDPLLIFRTLLLYSIISTWRSSSFSLFFCSSAELTVRWWASKLPRHRARTKIYANCNFFYLSMIVVVVVSSHSLLTSEMAGWKPERQSHSWHNINLFLEKHFSIWIFLQPDGWLGLFIWRGLEKWWRRWWWWAGCETFI